jgi:hypothetical protein
MRGTLKALATAVKKAVQKVKTFFTSTRKNKEKTEQVITANQVNAEPSGFGKWRRYGMKRKRDNNKIRSRRRMQKRSRRINYMKANGKY